MAASSLTGAALMAVASGTPFTSSTSAWRARAMMPDDPKCQHGRQIPDDVALGDDVADRADRGAGDPQPTSWGWSPPLCGFSMPAIARYALTAVPIVG